MRISVFSKLSFGYKKVKKKKKNAFVHVCKGVRYLSSGELDGQGRKVRESVFVFFSLHAVFVS